MTLLLSLLDDSSFYKKKKNEETSYVSNIINILIHGALFYGVVTVFALKIEGSAVESKISKFYNKRFKIVILSYFPFTAFTKDQFELATRLGITASIYYGLSTLTLTILTTLADILFENNSMWKKVWSFSKTILFSLFVLMIFFASTVSISFLILCESGKCFLNITIKLKERVFSHYVWHILRVSIPGTIDIFARCNQHYSPSNCKEYV